MLTRYKVKDEIIASGGSADIREGRLGGVVVAVKTVRITREMMPEIHVIHEVRDMTGCSVPHRLVN